MALVIKSPAETAQFKAFDTPEYDALSFAPSPVTAATIATAMPTAINAYSIAVVPDSSRRSLTIARFIFGSIG